MSKKLKKLKKKPAVIKIKTKDKKIKPGAEAPKQELTQNLVAVYVSPSSEDIEIFLKELKTLETGKILVLDDSTNSRHEKIYKNLNPDFLIFHKSYEGFEKSFFQIADLAKKSGLAYLVVVEPESLSWLEYINHFLEEVRTHEAVSGSRYLDPQLQSDMPDLSDSTINKIICHLINAYTGYRLTDAFARFKAFKIKSLEKINLKHLKFFPIHFWFELARKKIKFNEIPIPLSETKKKKLKARLITPSQKIEMYLKMIEELAPHKGR